MMWGMEMATTKLKPITIWLAISALENVVRL